MRIESGKSTKNSIFFRTGNMSVEAKYDEDENIKVKNYFIEDNDKEYTPFKPINFFAIMTVIINIVICIGNVPKIVNIVPILLAILFQLYTFIAHNKDCEILKNHSVEHKIISAVEKYSKDVTLDQIMKAPKLSRNCGTSMLIIYIVYKIIALTISIKYNMIIPETIVYILFRSTCTLFPIYYIGYLAQIFEFRKPEEKNYELGMAALNSLKDYFEKIENISFENANYEIIRKDIIAEIHIEDYIKRAKEIYQKELMETMENEIDKMLKKEEKEAPK